MKRVTPVASIGEAAVHPRRVAVLDDDVAFIRLMERVLEAEHVDVQPITTPDIDEALRVLAATHCGAALVDVYMYGDTLGFKLVERLRQRPEFTSLPVVVTSAARREVSKKAQFLQEHRCSVLLKPFEIDELIASLSSPPLSREKQAAHARGLRLLPKVLTEGGADAAGA